MACLDKLPRFGRNPATLLALCILAFGAVQFYSQDIDVRQMRIDQVPEARRHDRWIVVSITSSSPPDDMLFQLFTLKGWKVVVVGDYISKRGLDNSGGVIFLDTEAQKQLRYNIRSYLPKDHYALKNLGYLYAIQHGATAIYETEDEVRIQDKLEGFKSDQTMPGLLFAGNDTFNPYRHFGQSSLWPRGFSLKDIAKEQSRNYRLSPGWDTPLIQQGMVNGDVDVGDTFRLTRMRANESLDVNFDPVAPPVLIPRGVFSPFHSLNTLFHYGALWAMLLPKTTHPRVSDIWRSYWAQRLLWEIEGRMAFITPNAYQKRSRHRFVDKELDKGDTFVEDTSRLLDYLREWTCPQGNSFFQCVVMLSKDLASNKFWGWDDAELAGAWLTDLISMGYPEPKRVADFQERTDAYEATTTNNLPWCHIPNTTAPEMKEKSSLFIFSPVEQDPPRTWNKREQTLSTQVTEHIARFSKVCPNNTYQVNTTSVLSNAKAPFTFFNDVLLVFVFHYPFYENIPFLEASYRALFPNIAYCGVETSEFENASKQFGLDLSFIEAPLQKGCFGYLCAIRGMQLGFKVSGVFVVGDDVLMNPWNYKSFSKTKAWVTKGNISTVEFRSNSTRYGWGRPVMGKTAFQKTVKDLESVIYPKNVPVLKKFLEQSAQSTGKRHHLAVGLSDAYFIPSRLKDASIFYMTALGKNHMYLELTIPMTIYGLTGDIEHIKGHSRYGEANRKDMWGLWDPDIHYIHPFKLKKPDLAKNFCAGYASTLFKRIYG